MNAAVRLPGTLSLQEREQHALQAARALLTALAPEWQADEDLRDTPGRIARMYVHELCAGLTTPRPRLTTFPKPEAMDQMVAIGPIIVNSLCPHHFAPILGHAWVGVVPGNRLLGLSKYARLVRWCMARPVMQENATEMIAAELERVLPDALAIGVLVRAEHLCMKWRGVCEPSAQTVTSAMHGAFRTDSAARAEFFKLIEGLRT